jgi:hypothetical protein
MRSDQQRSPVAAVRSAFDIPHERECPACKGRGYPPAPAQGAALGAPQIIRNINGTPTTTELGYGCITCGGVGRIVDEK